MRVLKSKCFWPEGNIVLGFYFIYCFVIAFNNNKGPLFDTDCVLREVVMELDFKPDIIARFHFPERLLLSISHVNLFQINPSIYIHALFQT